MISLLASPSVCVVDDEEEDYEPILTVLNELFVSCVHILGNDIAKLPSNPFKRLQLVFLDLHLTNTTGKNAASHTANVFTRIVSAETAPIVVVIWSKYADDVSQGEEETEALLFKRMLLESEPHYEGRLIFVEMAKPKAKDKPEDWTDRLKKAIEDALQQQEAVELLWKWDSLVRDSTIAVGEALTTVATSCKQNGIALKDALKESMQRLAGAQGEGDFSPATAPGHLIAVLTELLSDQLEHADVTLVADHGEWLAAPVCNRLNNGFALHVNGLLLTSGPPAGSSLYPPGTVYRLTAPEHFKTLFGVEVAKFIDSCAPGGDQKAGWIASAIPVLLELSPVCDFAQRTRISALFVAGVIIPADMAKQGKRTGVFDASLPTMFIRWPAPDFAAQNAALIFNHRYKATIPVPVISGMTEAWFRLREAPTAAVRAAQSGHSSRIGFVQVGS